MAVLCCGLLFWKILRSYLGSMQNSSAVVVEEGSVAYILWWFAFYSLTLENRKCFPTQNHPLPIFWPPWPTVISFCSEVLYCLTHSFNHSFLRFFSDLVRHACFVSPNGWCWKWQKSHVLQFYKDPHSYITSVSVVKSLWCYLTPLLLGLLCPDTTQQDWLGKGGN